MIHVLYFCLLMKIVTELGFCLLFYIFAENMQIMKLKLFLIFMISLMCLSMTSCMVVRERHPHHHAAPLPPGHMKKVGHPEPPKLDRHDKGKKKKKDKKRKFRENDRYDDSVRYFEGSHDDWFGDGVFE